MNLKLVFPILFSSFLYSINATPGESLPSLEKKNAPKNIFEMWQGFDPRAEPLETEILKEWTQDGVALKILRYRIGVFKGKKAWMAGVYGFPEGENQLPGLLQIHGGGQYADYKAPLTNAKRGYATLSIAWAGRISAPEYRVSPSEVKLFWDGKIKDSNYKITTDWGALDAYHAPSRYGKDAFPSIPVEQWSLDSFESPRNNSWFLIALAARRGLTFLERQPIVDSEKLGVYGHSMGGKLTVLTAGNDKRVKAAAPSCGGISDRYSTNPLHLASVSDPPSLKQITCPIVFLSPSNDFHGRINDLPTAVSEIKASEWRISCSPHHNHQDTPEFEVLTQLWMDRYLKNSFSFPRTPKLNLNLTNGEKPEVALDFDESNMLSVDVYYTQQGQIDGKKDNSSNTKNRFWHYAKPLKRKNDWTAELPVFSLNSPLWVYANVSYELPKEISGAGYYYGDYTTKSFTISSLLKMISPSELKQSKVITSMQPLKVIEDFKDDWKKEWFTYKPQKWGLRTHKIYSPVWKPSPNDKLSVEIRSSSANKMAVSIDGFGLEIKLPGSNIWKEFQFPASGFTNAQFSSLKSWEGIKELRFDDVIDLRPPKGSKVKNRRLGTTWNGDEPEFRNLRWVGH
jgi:hypothetical protein